MVLTYVSITASYVPILFKAAVDAADKDEKKEAATEAPGSAAAPKAEQDEQARRALRLRRRRRRRLPRHDRRPLSVLLALLLVFAMALAMPFLAGASNFMGWIIIGIALYEAWKLNRRVPISGSVPIQRRPVRSGARARHAAGMPPPAAAP